MADRWTEKVLITPLRKKKRDGKLYARDARIEGTLVDLESITRDELITRCTLRRRDAPGYVPTECLLYFVRASRSDESDASFERLYKILAERVLRSLPKAKNTDSSKTAHIRSLIREKAFGRFVELISGDRTSYSEKLDYFELRFDDALANLRHDARKKVSREEFPLTSLEVDEESGEPSAEVERGAGSFDPFSTTGPYGADYRSYLDAAIEDLPAEQSRIVEMIRLGIPIDSKEEGAVTISKTLGKSEKTIRTYRDKAYAAIRAALPRGGEL